MSPKELRKPSRDDGLAIDLDQLRKQDSSGAGALGSDSNLACSLGRHKTDKGRKR
jgi:hypothetical protein